MRKPIVSRALEMLWLSTLLQILKSSKSQNTKPNEIWWFSSFWKNRDRLCVLVDSVFLMTGPVHLLIRVDPDMSLINGYWDMAFWIKNVPAVSYYWDHQLLYDIDGFWSIEILGIRCHIERVLSNKVEYQCFSYLGISPSQYFLAKKFCFTCWWPKFMLLFAINAIPNLGWMSNLMGRLKPLVGFISLSVIFQLNSTRWDSTEITILFKFITCGLFSQENFYFYNFNGAWQQLGLLEVSGFKTQRWNWQL